jgi:hypothetical protein
MKELGLARSRYREKPENLADCEVPVPILSTSRRMDFTPTNQSGEKCR